MIFEDLEEDGFIECGSGFPTDLKFWYKELSKSAVYRSGTKADFDTFKINCSKTMKGIPFNEN